MPPPRLPAQEPTAPACELHLAGDADELDAAAWDALLATQRQPTPFMRHAYLAALQASGSATPRSGWTPVYFTLRRGGALRAACALYLKTHSRGEYVFDWGWADAYARHGLAYYPKAVLAVPFTPVPGTRLLATDEAARATLLQGLLAWAREQELSSLHLLFGADEDLAAAQAAGLLLRHTVQFHWRNARPDGGGAFADFADFLASLSQDKRKKIRQERRRVQEAGVTFRVLRGREIGAPDWTFFYRCYERTYLEHGNAPYLTPDFFARMARELPEPWVLFIAERAGTPIAASLVAVEGQVAYGRYWGALERVDCLHFEACYYQPLQWCIAQGVQRFEGGAQGEHKMARALLPVQASSAHWLAHPAFADAVERFLEREGAAVEGYLQELQGRSPFRRPG
ncbi:GNAT family N-acetyltransferase [Melaminivora sp.]|uniref:GNAT family N-acetyltransferase n=1 Tax=Melaminivora sp. TaxID=1933032 RepID=UPI0028ACC89A|nr:GNAT family N-acetyltransferase [Melaminivora sp.]